MDESGLIVVLVHGWSVRSTETYGQLPARLETEASRANGPPLDVHEIWLGEYVSFHDVVRLEDVARAFQAAIERKIGALLRKGRRFACITHSTGGPVVREWWHRYWRRTAQAGVCPMSHLIMLAPANFGSALAQLGASRISRMKTWFEGVQPGIGLLEWLELGSEGSWALNKEWIELGDPTAGPQPVFPFVLAGQDIDRKLYDHLNSYTGEAGSDGVVRTAAANLNATYLRLEQKGDISDGIDLQVAEELNAPRTAFALLRKSAHSGKSMGILRSVSNDEKPHAAVSAILECLGVTDQEGYVRLCDKFDRENALVRKEGRVEVVKRTILKDNVYFHDAHSMVVFRIADDQGRPITDFDLLLTAGKKASPDLLPKGFCVDRQRNKVRPDTLTLYLNHDVMRGLPEPTVDRSGYEWRRPLPGTTHLGLVLTARPEDGFVHYQVAKLTASTQALERFVQPDRTTLVEVRLRRIVHQGTFELIQERKPTNFTGARPGEPIP